jgi:hypothetical protein
MRRRLLLSDRNRAESRTADYTRSQRIKKVADKLRILATFKRRYSWWQRVVATKMYGRYTGDSGSPKPERVG